MILQYKYENFGYKYMCKWELRQGVKLDMKKNGSGFSAAE